MIAKRRAVAPPARPALSERGAALLGPACLLILAAAVRLWNIGWGLPLLLHPDERPLVEAAWRVAGGDANPGFFRYPSALIYLLGAALRAADAVAGPLDEPQRYLVSRAAVALLGAAITPVVWRWCVLLSLGRWSLFAAALAAGSPALAIHSHYAAVDVPLALLFALAGYALSRLLLAPPGQRPRAALWAGCAAGLAMGVKYTAVLLLLPLAAAALVAAPPRTAGRPARLALAVAGVVALALGAAYALQIERVAALAAGLTSDGQLDSEYRALLRGAGWGAPLAGGLLLALAHPRVGRAAGALLSPALWGPLFVATALFACSSPFVLLDWRRALVDIMYEYRHSVAGAAAQYAAGAIAVQPPSPAANALLYAAQLWGDFGPALPLAALGVAGLWQKRRDTQKAGYTPVAVGLGVALPAALLLATLLRAGASAERYLLPAYPAACVLAALGARRVCEKLPRSGRRGAALAAACLVATAVALGGRLARFALPDTRAQAYAWAARHLPSGSAVANENYTQTVDLRGLPLRQLKADGLYDPARRWEARADYLLLGPAGGLPPGELAALARRYGPPLAVFAPQPDRSQGPTQVIFRLRPLPDDR